MQQYIYKIAVSAQLKCQDSFFSLLFFICIVSKSYHFSSSSMCLGFRRRTTGSYEFLQLVLLGSELRSICFIGWHYLCPTATFIFLWLCGCSCLPGIGSTFFYRWCVIWFTNCWKVKAFLKMCHFYKNLGFTSIKSVRRMTK